MAESDTIADANPDAKVVSTYWLLRTNTVNDTDCRTLIRDYDFDRAASLRSGYRLPSATGNFILAIDQNNVPFYIDLTRANDRQRRDAMMLWFGTAQQMAPGTPGAAITSNNFFDRLTRSFCDGNVTRNVTIGDVGEAALNPSPVAIGRIAFNAAGQLFCEARA